jgi:hypothetical protein
MFNHKITIEIEHCQQSYKKRLHSVNQKSRDGIFSVCFISEMIMNNRRGVLNAICRDNA